MSPNSNRNDAISNAMFIAMGHLVLHPDLPATHMINTVWHEPDETAAIDVHVDYRGGYAALGAWAESLNSPPVTVRRCPQGSTELAVTALAIDHPIKAWMHLHRTQRTLLWANLPGGEPELGETVVVPMVLLRKLAAAEAAIAETIKTAQATDMAAAQ